MRGLVRAVLMGWLLLLGQWLVAGEAQAAAPDAPAKPTVTPGNEELSVSWTAPDDNGSAITRYSMHYKARGASGWTTHPLGNAGTSTSTTITDLTNGTTYLLQVRAHNAAGISPFSATARGTPRTVPDAPARPTVTAGDEELEVEWTAPDDNGSAITRYSMHYKARGASGWTTHPLGNAGTSTSTTITDLTNGTTYLLQVRAHNAAGISGFSATARGTPRAAPDAPAKPAVTPRDEELSVSWTAPDDNGSAITDYDVRYKRTSATSWRSRSFSGTGTSTTIGNLINGAEYEVQVQAENAAGESSWSASATGTPRGKPDAPAAPTVSVGDEQVSVSWVAPDDNGAAITDYDVNYKQTSASNWSNHPFSGTGTSTTITGLTNGVAYVVRVRAQNAAGESDWSPDGVPPPTPAKPGAPTLGEGDGQLSVSWTAPDDNGSAITDYDVRYKQTSVSAWSNHSFTGTGTSTTIGSLTNGMAYEVQVQAKNAGGASAWSDSTTGTPRGEPAKPAAPTLGEGDGQLSVSWVAPANNGAAISDYDVRYKQTSASSWSNHAFTGTGTSTTIDNLTNDVEYEVQVLAKNAGGDSDWSDSATATPTSGEVAPATPTGLTGPAAGAVTDPYTISWTAATGATYYGLREWLDDGSQPSDDDWTTYDTGSATSKTFTGQASGSWDYQVRACNMTGCSDWSGTFTVVVPGSVPNAPAPIVTETTTVLSADELTSLDKVGTLPGEFRVAESGAATYSIPLTLARGTAGVVPPLGLHYSSQRGNGLLGVGWTIDGLSAITRCRQTHGQDRNPAALTYTDSDRFCLDGQRLLVTSGTYGAPDSQYKTEIDQFLTVTAKGGSAGKPDYFEVKRKDGSVSRYGGTNGQASEHTLTDPADAMATRVLTWALQEFKDSAGNKIEYVYTDDGTGHRISEVRYAYGNGSTAQAAVRFTYVATRKDKTVGYLVGNTLQNTQRLTQVTVRASGQALRNYRLRYDTVATTAAPNELSRLAGVKECAESAETACLPETVFTWSAPKALFKTAAATTLALNSDSSWKPVDFSPADINGDGLTDLAWTETKGSKHRIQYALANKATGALASARFANNVANIEYEDDYGTSNYGDNLRVHAEVVDYNADGRHDLIIYSRRANQTKVHLAKPQTDGSWKLDGTGTLLFSGRYRYADLDSDGLLDAYRLVPQLPTQAGQFAPTGYQLEVRYLKRDANAAVTSSTYYAFGPATTKSLAFTPQTLDPDDPTSYLRWQSLETAKLQVADVDGDGRADLVTWGSDTTQMFDMGGGYTSSVLQRLEVFRQTDTGFDRYGTALDVAPSITVVTPKGLRVQDLNQDGLSDLVYFVGKWYKKSNNNYQWTGDWHYRLSTGAGFADAVTLVDTADNAQAPSSLSLHDDNGDGYPDLLWHDVPARKLWLKRWLPSAGGFQTTTPTTVRTTTGKDEEQYFTLDMNGDGNGDLLHVSESGSTETLKTYLHATSGRPHLITSITNGLKAVTDIRYESLGATDAYTRVDKLRTTSTTEERCFSWHGSGRFCWPVETAQLNASDFYRDLNDPWPGVSDPVTGGMVAPVLELMGPLYVVTRVDSSAPTAASATAKSGIGYAYAQGKVQAAGRGLLGFKSLTTVDLQTGVRTTTTYRQDFPYIGLPLKTEVRTQDDKRLRSADNTWKLVGYQTDDTTTTEVNESWEALAALSGTAALSPLQPYLAKAEEKVYALPVTDDKGTTTTDDDTVTEGALLSTVTTDTVQDDWGNPTKITTTTVDHVNNKRFRQVTDNQYAAPSMTVPGEPNWTQRYGRLTRTAVMRARDKAKGNGYENGTEATRKSAFRYYTSGTAQGLLWYEEREQGNKALSHRTTYRYDAFGNRVGAMVRARSGATEKTALEIRCSVRNQAVQTRAYDTFGRYPLTEKDCLDRTRRTLTYNAHGLPLTVAARLNKTTSAALTTRYSYTAGGRRYFERDGTGAYTAALRVSCAMNTDCPTGAAFYDETRQPGNGTAQKYRTSRVYRDVLGRTVRTAVRGFNNGKWIHTDTEYDALGRVERRSEPYYADAAKTHWTSFEYDLLGRVVKTVLPDDTAMLNSEITVSYAGLTTTTTNAKGQTQRETRNALDEVIETRDHAGTTVTHTYDAWGQVTKTVVAGTGVSAVTSTMTYDKRGRRTGMTDPDRGAMTYDYNGFDELVKQADARDHYYQVMTYDGLGRMKMRKDYGPDGDDAGTADDVVGEAAWTWDEATNGLGQVQTVTDTKSGYTRTLTYDTLGRVDVTTITPGTGADTYHEKQTYDGYGRPFQHFDAARTEETWADNVTEVQYNAYGYAYKWVDGVYENGNPKATYRQITFQDARGNVTGEKLGGGALRSARTFDAATGRIGAITSTTLMGSERQELGYTWDVLGNLTQRTDTTGATGAAGTRDLTESFTYDTLNRLTSSQVGTGTKQTVTYDALGNIKTKGGVTYTYGAGTAGPHAVTRAGDNRYSYDASGNMTEETPVGSTTATRSLTYTSFNKVASIDKGNHKATFAYGPERARFMRTDTDDKGTTATTDDTTTTTLYVGSVEKVTYSGSLYEYKRYIAAGVALVTEKHETTVTNGTPTTTETVTTKYLLRDHLGSVAVITNALGAVDQELSYDAWGQRRNAETWGDITALARMSFDTSRTTRGYTGHEMVDAVGIIHMNGRIYDPNLGRFLQADPVVQFPDYSQSHNRYSYVLNNPLAYTDPTGYIIPIFTAIAVGIVAAGIVETTILAAALIGAGVFADSLTQGVPLDKAFLAGVSAAALTAAGLGTFPETFGLNLATAGHVATVATVGGITTALQGGKFGNGFLSAGLGSAAPALPGLRQVAATGIPGRALVSAVTAGTVSEITGGKFANGAVSAAFLSLVSSAAQAAADNSNKPNFSEMTKEEKVAWIQENADKIGLDFSKVNDINLDYSNKYNIVGLDRYGVPIQCSSDCFPWAGVFHAKTGTLYVFGQGFEGAPYLHIPTRIGSDGLTVLDSVMRTYTPMENLIHTIGHEVGHSLGLDVGTDLHIDSDRMGMNAVDRFRGM